MRWIAGLQASLLAAHRPAAPPAAPLRTMKLSSRILAALFVLAAPLLFTACTSKSDQDTSIPWSRPAGWEGQIPGMGTTPGSGNR